MKAAKLLFLIIFILFGIYSKAQVLRDNNFNYQYSVTMSPFMFELKPVRLVDKWIIFFRLQLPDSTHTTDQFSIQWEKRSDLNEKEGILLSNESVNLSILKSTKEILTGKLTLSLTQARQILVAKILNNEQKQTAVFFRILEPNYPVNGYLQSVEGEMILDPYVNIRKSILVDGYSEGQLLHVSYYDDTFPTAAPVFSEGQARVNQIIKPDSTFTIKNGQPFNVTSKGLYLVQKDTSSSEGISFRAEDGYPKFKRVPDLVGPFMYVCSKTEYDKLRTSGNDKKQFDRGVLAITNDSDRAKDFMKTYFRRAEAANRYFTSYKEGWKTDRGMVYMIYGEPQRVFKFLDREVWSYNKTTFTFIKSSTLFDPDNFVLIRDRKYTEGWYEKVDLLRSARF